MSPDLGSGFEYRGTNAVVLIGVPSGTAGRKAYGSGGATEVTEMCRVCDSKRGRGSGTRISNARPPCLSIRRWASLRGEGPRHNVTRRPDSFIKNLKIELSHDSTK